MARRAPSLRPRLPTGAYGFGFGRSSGFGLGYGSWPEVGDDSCETRTSRAGADGERAEFGGVLRIQTETFQGNAEPHVDERYLISSMPSVRLTADHWLLVARRHWGVETSHQILDTAFEEDDHPWIEACTRAALVVAILRRIAYTMLALFRSVTQRSDERRATPWQTLMTDLFVSLISTTELELRDPKPLRPR